MNNVSASALVNNSWFHISDMLSPPQLQPAAGGELCLCEGHQQHHGGPVLQGEEGPGGDVEHCWHRHRGPRLLSPLLPGSGVSED